MKRIEKYFIENSLHNEEDKINLLQSNLLFDTFCYIPLNMSILLCLTEDGIDTLPKTQTKLFEKFVIMTIVHFLKKDKKLSTASICSLMTCLIQHSSGQGVVTICFCCFTKGPTSVYQGRS